MTYLIGFSGPPRSGKDSIAAAVASCLSNVQILSCSTPMRDMVYAMLGRPYSLEHYEAHKDAPQDVFRGASIRQAMIHLSESSVKPRYGPDFWGRSLLARRPIPPAQVTLVTDCGFAPECDVFAAEYGADRCLWVQVHREGRTFAGDSRGYVQGPGPVLELQNNGSLNMAALQVQLMMAALNWIGIEIDEG